MMVIINLYINIILLKIIFVFINKCTDKPNHGKLHWNVTVAISWSARTHVLVTY